MITISRTGSALLVSLALVGCGKNDECTRLEALLVQHNKTLEEAKVRANARKKLQERADKSEAAMNKLLADSGVEQEEDAVHALLLARVAKIPTATITRGLADVGTTEEGETMTTAEWRARFSARDVKTAWDHVVSLAAVPPTLVLTGLSRSKGKDEWTLTLRKPPPVRIPVMPGKVPLVLPDDAGTIPSQLGFCGAHDRRNEIAAVRAQIAALREDAETAAMLLATAPTFEGIRRRTEKVVHDEKEARDVMGRVMEGVIAQKLPLKGIGYEDPSVLVELWGGPKELKALETLLLPFGDRVKPTELTAPDVVRRAVLVRQSARSHTDH